MADVKFSALTAQTTLEDTNELALADSGASKKVTWANIRAQLIPASARTVKTDGDFTTTSATFVDITGATASITIAQNSRILIAVTGYVENSTAAAYAPIEVVIGSTAQGGTYGLTMLRDAGGSAGHSIGISFLSATLSAGSHTVKVQARATAGTTKVWASSTAPLILSLLEVRT